MKNNLLLLSFSLLAALFIGEIICRVKGTYLSYNERTGAGGYVSPFEADENNLAHRYKPHQVILLQRHEFTDSWTANEDGLKEKTMAATKEGKRILVLGDSYTEGVGAPPDSSYPRILERLLRQHGDSTVQVINAGVGGSDIFFEYKLFLALLPKYKPDAVVVTVNSSDVMEHLTRGGFERFADNNKVRYRSAPWFEPLYAHSLLVRLLVHDVFHYDFSFIRKQNYTVAMASAQKDMAVAIDSFAAACGARHLPLHVLFHPFYPEIERPETYGLKGLAAHCAQKNIRYSNAFSYLTAKGIDATNWKNIYWPSDGHFNRHGYQLLAECAAEMVKHTSD